MLVSLFASFLFWCCIFRNALLRGPLEAGWFFLLSTQSRESLWRALLLWMASVSFLKEKEPVARSVWPAMAGPASWQNVRYIRFFPDSNLSQGNSSFQLDLNFLALPHLFISSSDFFSFSVFILSAKFFSHPASSFRPSSFHLPSTFFHRASSFRQSSSFHPVSSFAIHLLFILHLHFVLYLLFILHLQFVLRLLFILHSFACLSGEGKPKVLQAERPFALTRGGRRRFFLWSESSSIRVILLWFHWIQTWVSQFLCKKWYKAVGNIQGVSASV